MVDKSLVAGYDSKKMNMYMMGICTCQDIYITVSFTWLGRGGNKH